MLEKLVFLPAVWPIVLELTNGKPMLASGTMLVDSPDGHTEAVQLHCARDDYGFESARYEVRRGRIYCDDFVVFPYLDDVLPGDGGYSWCRGRTKASSTGRGSYLIRGSSKGRSQPGVVNITPAAGDAVVMPECVTHGVLPGEPPTASAEC